MKSCAIVRGGLMYYEYDGLGNVMDITDRLGNNVMSYRYDAYGNLFTQMAAPYNDLGYTGYRRPSRHRPSPRLIPASTQNFIRKFVDEIWELGLTWK